MVKDEVDRQFIVKHNIMLDAGRVDSLQLEHDEGMVVAVLDLNNAKDADHLSVAPLLHRAEAFVCQVDMHVVVAAGQSMVFLRLGEPIILVILLLFGNTHETA